MSTTIPLAEAPTRLPELIGQLAPGAELVITRDGETVTVTAVAAVAPGSPAGWVAARHWDALPACYFVGGVVGMAGYAAGWSPLAGFAAGFAAAGLAVAAVFAAAPPAANTGAADVR